MQELQKDLLLQVIIFDISSIGKTESVNDLAKTLATPCIVFNCSENITLSSMSKLFMGVASSGCFITFDEFNRL
jgi:dynein heavy chain